MKQQFIGLFHCKCGTSWRRDIGFFERTPDMVFSLERKKIGNKIKQLPTNSISKQDHLKYTKSKLNPVYLQEHEKKAILSEMSHIQLDKKDI